MDKKLLTLLYFFLFLTQNTGCQKMKEQALPEFQVEISHPSNELDITPITDKIPLLEGGFAALPYGSTSGSWGWSGKGWTEQYGTPIGADIIYFSRYEDTFYHLKAGFPIDKIKNYMKRAYAQGEASLYTKPISEYQDLGRFQHYGSAENPYQSFSTLVFGFAPKGMVVVWLRFGIVQIELGRFQSEIIKDDKELEKKLFSNLSVSRTEMKEKRFLDISSKQWDDYREKYLWKPIITSENKGLRTFEMNISYYNGEAELLLMPWISNAPERLRAIPKELNFVWQSAKNQQYIGGAYFNWEKANEIFKKENKGTLEFKISSDNRSFQVLFNDKPVPTDSIRIFQSDQKYKDSY